MAVPYPTDDHRPPAGVSTSPSSKVELYISCKNLIDTDLLSKSDPIVAVYTIDNTGRTVEVRHLASCALFIRIYVAS